MQRLPPEAERVDRLEVLDVAQFARGVLLDGRPDVVFGHPHAVVADDDPLGAAGLDGDGDPTGVGVQGVLQQLLDDGGGPLDHLAGGDAVPRPRVEFADVRTHRGSLPSPGA